MAKRKKSWAIVNNADLIDQLEYAVYLTCKRLGWDMSRTREGDNFRKIETWLPYPGDPNAAPISRIDVFLDTQTKDQMWRILYEPKMGHGKLTRTENAIFMKSLEQSFDKTLSHWKEEHDEVEEPYELSAGSPSDPAIPEKPERKTIDLSSKPAGRKVDGWNPIAFNILNDGKEKASERAFECWCREQGIEDVTKGVRNAFKKAMERERERRGRIR